MTYRILPPHVDVDVGVGVEHRDEGEVARSEGLEDGEARSLPLRGDHLGTHSRLAYDETIKK